MFCVGTYDVQYVNVEEKYLSVDYLENSTAIGVLLYFFSDDFEHYFLYVDKEVSKNYTFKPSMTTCTMVAFDIESNGYLTSGNILYPATKPRDVTHIKSNFSKLVLFCHLCF